MCVVCDNETTEALGKKWIPYEQATHLVVGYCNICAGGGVLLTAGDQLSAYRYRKIYRAHGYPNADVVLNNDEQIKRVSESISGMMVEQDEGEVNQSLLSLFENSIKRPQLRLDVIKGGLDESYTNES